MMGQSVAGGEAKIDESGVPIATVDLGSNSFHLLVARWTGTSMRVVDRQKEMVRLAAGLDRDRRLLPEAEALAIETLRRFGERIGGVPAENVRAVGTNTFRAARDISPFLERASEALGHRIEVIDGAEEARLIYLGVAYGTQPGKGHQLVVDIGGGSTELVIGEGFEPRHCHSLHMGCVSFTRGFFPDGAITRDRLRAATFAASNEIASLESQFHELGWTRAVGSSGTIRAIEEVLRAEGWSDAGITAEGLEPLGEALVAAGKISKLSLTGLSERRRDVLVGGFAILRAVFDRLRLKQMKTSASALREGAAYDLVGRFEGQDLRDATVHAMQQRYGVDRKQADRVAQRLEGFLAAVAEAWGLSEPRWRRYARWAAALHEVGLSLSYSGYHKHGAYLIENSNLAGFSRLDQALVAALVLCHRRKFRHETLTAVSTRPGRQLILLAALLRLAVRVERSRGTSEAPEVALEAHDQRLVARLPAGTAAAHPMLLADLEEEKSRLERADITLDVGEAKE